MKRFGAPLSGVSEEDFEKEGTSVRVLSLQDLLANKRASGRPKDLLDAQLLERLIAEK